jgi:dTDP-4-amino-4,6-dideoxygalactose transaminase
MARPDSFLTVNKPLYSADPKASYLAARAEIDAAVARVLTSGTYIHGPEVAGFEAELATYLGVTGAAGVANGTDALELALRAVGVGPGDQVVTVANTVTATVAAIRAVGAEPLLVEIDDATMLLSPAALERALAADSARRIKAIVPVHLYGLMCEMPAILRLAQAHGAKVVEDCAQSHGSTFDGRKAGTFGDAAAFSFYPTKNLGALGDAGAVVSQHAAIVARVKSLRQYGWQTRYVADEHGRNSRLDELQAAILRARLPRLDVENAHRARLAAAYRAGLAGTPLRLPDEPAGRGHTWHQFVVRSLAREALKAHLAAEGVHCGVLYPVPVHHQPAYRSAVSLPVAERACAEVLSLPLHAGVTEGDVARVCAAVRGWKGR